MNSLLRRLEKKTKATRRLTFILAAALAVSLAVGLTPAFAVHDIEFEIDGNIINNGLHSPVSVDWVNLFDVSGTNVPTPKSPLPANFGPAVFFRDFTPGGTDDSTTYTTGSKDIYGINPATGNSRWQCAGSNNISDKTDLLNTYATAFTDPATGDTIVYFGLETASNEGTRDVGFWLLKDPNVGCTSPNGRAVNFSGHHSDGDILITAEYTGSSGVSSIQAFRWTGDDTGSLNTTPFLTGGDCSAAGSTDEICASTNSSPLLHSNGGVPWLTQTKLGKTSTPGLTTADLDTGEFFEGGLKLPSSSGCFATFLADTRASTSPSSTIFDFRVGSFGLCSLSLGKACDTNVSPNPTLLDDHVTLRTTFNVPITSGGSGTIHNVSLAEVPSPALGSGESCKITAIQSKTGAVPHSLTLPSTFSGTTAQVVYDSLAGHTTANVTVMCDTLSRNPFINKVNASTPDIPNFTATHTTGSGETCALSGNASVTTAKCCDSVTIDPNTFAPNVCVTITLTNNSNPAEALKDIVVKDDKLGTVTTGDTLDATGAGASKTYSQCYTPDKADSTTCDPVTADCITFTDHVTEVSGTGVVSGDTFDIKAPDAALKSATCNLCGPQNQACPTP